MKNIYLSNVLLGLIPDDVLILVRLDGERYTDCDWCLNADDKQKFLEYLLKLYNDNPIVYEMKRPDGFDERAIELKCRHSV